MKERRRNDSVESTNSNAPAVALEEHDDKTKLSFWQKFRVRARAATLMMLGFMSIVWAGHMYVCILVMILQGLSFREVVNVRYREYKSQMDVQMPLFRTLQWLWYGLAMVFVYGDFIKVFSHTHESAAWLVPYTRHHGIVTFGLYCLIFMISVGTLQKNSVKYQVGQLSWTIVTLCIVVGQMKFVANNIFDGLFWFVFPVWLVINNDCWAYFWGILFGRRFIRQPFFSLSPKKTWEGFIGAFFSTIFVGYITAPWFCQIDLFTCPATHLTFVPHPHMECSRRSFFQKYDKIVVFHYFQFYHVVPAQLHAIVFAAFASVVAPFGGFLASAIKRAYHVKDFAGLLPGHGGITDRVDCEFITHLFLYVYLNAFIRGGDYDWQKAYSMSQLLTPQAKLALFSALKQSLISDGILSS